MQDTAPPFDFIGNNPAVDFTNTEVVVHGALVDRLRQAADLAQWANEAGFRLDRRLKAADLADAHALRAALKALFQARIDRQPPGRKALAVINSHLAKHCPHRVLRARGGADYELAESDDALSVSALLARLALEGAQLLASPRAEQLRRCSNPACVLTFVDTSRSRKRRWCSMETCGNRAKVARHYRTHTGR